MQAELIRRIAALEDHLDDLCERLRLADQPAVDAYNDWCIKEDLHNLYSRSWNELTEVERNTWRAKV